MNPTQRMQQNEQIELTGVVTDHDQLGFHPMIEHATQKRALGGDTHVALALDAKKHEERALLQLGLSVIR